MTTHDAAEKASAADRNKQDKQVAGEKTTAVEINKDTAAVLLKHIAALETAAQVYRHTAVDQAPFQKAIDDLKAYAKQLA